MVSTIKWKGFLSFNKEERTKKRCYNPAVLKTLTPPPLPWASLARLHPNQQGIEINDNINKNLFESFPGTNGS